MQETGSELGVQNGIQEEVFNGESALEVERGLSRAKPRAKNTGGFASD